MTWVDAASTTSTPIYQMVPFHWPRRRWIVPSGVPYPEPVPTSCTASSGPMRACRYICGTRPGSVLEEVGRHRGLWGRGDRESARARPML